MKTVWRTLDGSIFADKNIAMQHELDEISRREKKLCRMKQTLLPLAQKDYDQARKELSDFFHSQHERRKMPLLRRDKANTYAFLASLYRHVSASYSTLLELKNEYKRLKFVTVQLKERLKEQ